MARDLIKFFDNQKKSFTRYVSNVDSLLEKYEDTIEDEMQSVIDLSTNQIYKGKETLFFNEKEFDSVCDQSLILHKDKDSSVLMTVKNTERSINTDFFEDTDTIGYVEKFLGEDEPDPSEGETLSSESTCSYIAIYSDYEEDNSQDELSQDDNNRYTTDNTDLDEVDGDISGTSVEDTRPTRSDNSKYRLPDVAGRKLTHEDVDKDQESRLDETYIMVDEMDDTDIKENQCAKSYYNKSVPEIEKTRLQSFYSANHSDIKGRKLEYDDIKRSSEGKNVKRVLTIFTPFSDSEIDKNKNKQNKNKGLSIENELSPEDRWFSERFIDQRKESQNKIKLSKNNADIKEQVYGSYLELPRNHIKNYSPKRTSEQFSSSMNDLSPCLRVKSSPQLFKRNNKASSMRPKMEEHNLNNGKTHMQKLSSPLNQRYVNDQNGRTRTEENFRPTTSSDVHKSNTPLHHKQARGMLMSKKWQALPLPNDNSTGNETELESFNDDNRSSKKDSGFGTLNEDSLSTDTPVIEEVPEILSLENLDTFNKSLANQSAFLNVSSNCAVPKKEETAATVEKWLKDMSKEMNEVFEISLDREDNRLSLEMCKDIGDCKTDNVREFKNRNEKRLQKNNRERSFSAECFEGNVLCSPPKISISSQPLKNQYRSDPHRSMQNDFKRQERQRASKGDRHSLKAHRNSTQEIFQQLKAEQVAELMKNCDKGENGQVSNVKVNKQRRSEFTGKRFIEHSDEMVGIEDMIDVLPTPPKSRKLNQNNNSQFRNRQHGRSSSNNFNGDKQGRVSSREKNIVDKYIENENKNRFHENEKREMLAYMLHRDSSKKPSSKKLEFENVRTPGNELSCGERYTIDKQREEYYNLYHETVNTNFQIPQNIDNNQGKKKSPFTRGSHRSPDKRLQRSFDVGCQKNSNTSWQKSPKTRRGESSDIEWQRSPKARPQENYETYHHRSPETRVQVNSDTVMQQNSDRRLQRSTDPRIEKDFRTVWQISPERRIPRDVNSGVQRDSRGSEMVLQRQTRLQGNSETELQRSPEARIIHRQSEIENNRSPYSRQRQRSERELRIQNVNISPSHQYKVSHSYIRKLKCRDKLEDTEEEVDGQDYNTTNHDLRDHTERVYEKNPNDYQNVLESSPNTRNRQRILHLRYEDGGRLLEENEYELNERRTVGKRSGRYREEHDEEYHRSNDIYAQYSPRIGRRSESGDNMYEEVDIGDEMYRQQNSFYGENSPSVRSGGKNPEGRSELGLAKCSRYDKFVGQSERNHVQSEDFFDKGMHGYGNRDNFPGEVYNSRKQRLSSRPQGSRDDEVQRLEHFNGASIDNKSPRQHRDDRGVESKSDKTVTQHSHNEFRSPSVQRIRASTVKEDAFSPSTSLAKMRLNTPESKSRDTSRQHRRNRSRENEFDQNVSHLTTDYDMHVSSLAERTFDAEADERFVPYPDNANNISKKSPGTKVQSSPKFVSLDQIQGMPLQLRIQQLGASHSNRRGGKGENTFRYRESSNQYICEKSNDTSEQFENGQDNSIDERSRNSNVYHEYYNVISTNNQERGPSLGEENYNVNRNENTTEFNRQKVVTVPNEQRIKKSLFVPINENKKQNPLSLKCTQSGLTFDAFKIPMTPPVMTKMKPNPQNKENVCAENSTVCNEKTKCATAPPRNHRREGLAINLPRTRTSTPIKPGCSFMLNTTMSTIVGSEDTQL